MSRKSSGSEAVLEGVPVLAEELRAEAAARPSMKSRITGNVAAAVAGWLAGRALQPVAGKAARRLGMPAKPMMRIVEIAAPFAVSSATAMITKRRAARRARP